MPDKMKVMVMGGHTEAYHQFSVMAPIYRDFLTAAGFDVFITENRDDFEEKRIESFQVIVDYTTAGDLTDAQRDGLLGSIKRGKGFVGVHSAGDSFKNTPGYLNMVGGKFLIHPSGTVDLTFNVKNRRHPVVKDIEDFRMAEELYLMETYGHFEVLMSTWYEEFERPITWVKPYGLGKVVYTALGHGEEQTRNENFQQLLINAINWTAS